MAEIWRRCKIAPLYQVSNKGRVRRLKDGLVITPRCNADGYLSVHVWINNLHTRRLVHCLVARTFVSGYEPGLEVNHKDGRKENNKPKNLEWVTHYENIQHSVSTGLQKKRKLTMKQVQLMKLLRERGKSQKYLAHKFGVCQATVQSILAGKRYFINSDSSYIGDVEVA